MDNTTTIEWKNSEKYVTMKTYDGYICIEVNQDMPQSFIDEIKKKIEESKNG